jgi:ATP-dependent helicase Lhr and Lhr-like helicase
MIRRVHKRYSLDEMLSLMDPLLQEWFRGKYERLTPPQAYTVPLIHKGKNVLVSSPTGSGKTVTAFLSIINELYLLQKKGELEDRIYCVYISPLKALANDINRNLNTPLKELTELAEKLGIEPPNIKVAVRSGDTTTSERAKMARKPPHIFITTPESLGLILSTTKFSEKFQGVRYIIVDEIHELTNSKRGVMLSLSLERLESLIQRSDEEDEDGENDDPDAPPVKSTKKPAKPVTPKPPVRIGLSATQAPINEIARFLAGYVQGLGKDETAPAIHDLPDHDRYLRPINIVEVTERKPLDLKVLCPVEDMNLLPFEVVNARMYDQLAELVREHTTTLVFTNTRSATEAVVFKLKEKGIRDIAAHHGSLSRETRLEVEEQLKNGDLRVVVSSTSLELGIDIGSIDLVVQLNSPKTVAKGLQRIGRAGHGVYDISKGRIIVFDRDDLIESAVLTKFAYDGFIDRIHILHNSLDVLAQSLVGLSLEQKWEIDRAYSLITRSYPFRSLGYKEFIDVLNYVGGGDARDYTYSKVWLDDQGGTFGIKRGSRMIYNMNLGTIPQESSFKVMLQQRGIHLGSLSEKFVEKLDQGDIFLLGGKTYEFIESEGMRVVVKNAHGRKPTVPSWAGEMLPRSYDLSLGVGKFRGYVAGMIAKGTAHKAIEDTLMEEYLLDRGSARSIVNYLAEQLSIIPEVPSEKKLLIEGFIDERGRRNLIYHFPFGRRVNDALSRAYGRVITKNLSSNVKISLTDDNFMLTFSHRMPVVGSAELVRSDELEEVLRKSVRYTELFKQRFRHCANRGFMILKNYLGREIPMEKQQFRSVRILEAIHGMEKHPILLETYNEILHDVMDIDSAKEVLQGIETGKIGIVYEDYHEIPSPLAHNIVLMGISDIVLMEDRSALLRELHKKVLSTAFSEEEFKYRLSMVEEYFKEKRPSVEGKEDLVEVIGKLQPLNLFIERGRNIFEYSDVERETLQKWCRELVDQGAVESIFKDGELWALKEDVADFKALYSMRLPMTNEEKEFLKEIPTEIDPENLKDLGAISGKLGRRKDMLRKFQRAYSVKSHFVKDGDDWTQVHLRVKGRRKKAEYESALDRAILRHLELFAPANLEELSYYLSLGEGMLASGTFRVFDEETVTAYLHEKQLVETIDDYLDLFGSAPSARVVFKHVKSFSKERWLDLMKKEVAQGRFVRHRVSYVRKTDVPLYVAAYQDPESLEPLDLRILKTITGKPGMSKREIAQSVDAPLDMVEESIDRLDYALMICRIPEDRVGGEVNSVNLYEPISRHLTPENEIDYETARERIIMEYVGAFGPTTMSDIRRSTMFRMEEIERVLSSNREMIEKITVTGDVEMIMYLLKDDLEALESFEGTIPGVEIHSRMDPSIRHHMHEIRSRFGEGWYSPITHRGRPVGVVIHWTMSDAIDVRDILLEDGFQEDHPAELARGLEEFMRFYRETGRDIIRIRRMARTAIKDLPPEVIHEFAENGFKRIHTWLVSGDLIKRSFHPEELLAYIFYRQHLHQDSLFENSLDAVESMGGIRNNFELQLRVRNPEPLQVATRNSKLVSAIAVPSYLLNMTIEQAGIYQRARDLPLTPEMEEVLTALSGRMHYKELFIRTSLQPSKFKDTLKLLRDGMYILKMPWSYYRMVPGAEMSKEKAQKWVMRTALDSLGIVTAERLYQYFKGAFKMSVIRGFLSGLEHEGYLTKGFLNKKDESLYYIIDEDIKKVLQHPFHQDFVLSPQDRLFHYLAEEIKETFRMGACYVVFQGTKMTGAFKIKKQGRLITIREFRGGDEERQIVRYWGSVNNFVMLWDE